MSLKRINIKITEKQYEELEKLVELGEFANITEAIRTAIRLLLEEYRGVEHEGGKEEGGNREV